MVSSFSARAAQRSRRSAPDHAGRRQTDPRHPQRQAQQGQAQEQLQVEGEALPQHRPHRRQLDGIQAGQIQHAPQQHKIISPSFKSPFYGTLIPLE